MGRETTKPLRFVATALDDLRAFPKDARRDVGFQLNRLEQGLQPDHFKPMKTVGAGAAEIIVDTGEQYRVFYVAKLKGAVYVLHAFQKKTRKTSQSDIDLGKKRYKLAVEDSKET